MKNLRCDAVTQLARFIRRHAPVTVLTGAGISTASGIPDYRDDDGQWKQRRPMLFADFVSCANKRRQYWAQSFAGWRRMSTAQPNVAHEAIALMEQRGFITAVITQNVDNLHRDAGNRNVIDLHGNLRTTRCLDCNDRRSRLEYQRRLESANPGWKVRVAAIAPDGDARLRNDSVAAFRVPDCVYCGGIVKPDVVFFGEAVPRKRVADASATVERSAALLVIGSSLMVFSGFRYARIASESGKPLAIVNRGATRADELATLRLVNDCTEILPQLAIQLAA